MKHLLTFLTCTAFALTPSLAQDEEKKLSPAEELLKITRFESAGIEAAVTAFDPVLKQFENEGVPEKGLEEIKSAFTAYFHQVMSDPDLLKGVVTLYNEVFTEDELLELIAFYKTPIGQKSLIQMPLILGESMQLGQKHAEKYAPQFQEQLEKILAKYQGGDNAPGEEEGEAPAPPAE